MFQLGRRILSGVLDAPSKELRRLARRESRTQVRRLREKKRTTNPYHREQYINAYVEAYSARVVHQHVVAASSSSAHALLQDEPSSTLSSNSRELVQLAHELEERHGHRSFSQATSWAQSKKRCDVSTAYSVAPASEAAPFRDRRVAFGAWRSTADGGAPSSRLQAQIRSVDVMRHCVLREALTPPVLSPEVIQRSSPPRQLPPVRSLLSSLRCVRDSRHISTPVNFSQLHSRMTAALGALRDVHAHQRSLALYAVLCLTHFTEWTTASSFVVWLVQRWPQLIAAGASSVCLSPRSVREDLSYLVALFFEVARDRCGDAAYVAPSLEQLTKVCNCLHECFIPVTHMPSEGSGGHSYSVCDVTGGEEGCSPSPRWDPVVSAPLLGLMGAGTHSGSCTATPSLEHMRFLSKCFCIHRSPRPSGKLRTSASLGYMPAVAWGEYLRAQHRCGASLNDLQEATDRLTDAADTLHANTLMADTHVWNAYLACSPGPHAKEVYEKNLRAYRVLETPATTAAVMMALLRDGTRESCADARLFWKRLWRSSVSTTMLPRTCSTTVAYIRLLEAERNAADLILLMHSYESLYEPFGVPKDWFDRQTKLFKAEEVEGEDDVKGAKEGLCLFLRACKTYPFHIPSLVRHTLQRALERTTTAAEEGALAAADAAGTSSVPLPEGLDTSSPVDAVPVLTAEDLAASL